MCKAAYQNQPKLIRACFTSYSCLLLLHIVLLLRLIAPPLRRHTETVPGSLVEAGKFSASCFDLPRLDFARPSKQKLLSVLQCFRKPPNCRLGGHTAHGQSNQPTCSTHSKPTAISTPTQWPDSCAQVHLPSHRLAKTCQMFSDIRLLFLTPAQKPLGSNSKFAALTKQSSKADATLKSTSHNQPKDWIAKTQKRGDVTHAETVNSKPFKRSTDDRLGWKCPCLLDMKAHRTAKKQTLGERNCREWTTVHERNGEAAAKASGFKVPALSVLPEHSGHHSRKFFQAHIYIL